MIVHFITAIALAILAVIFVWAVYRTFNRPMPRALFPMLAACSAIGYGIYSEYTWESRTLAQLPDSVRVVHQYQGRSVFSPWSYVFPRTDRLSVVDSMSMRRNENHPQLLILELLFIQRFNPVISVRQMVDCDRGRRVDLLPDQTFDSDGLPDGAQWVDLERQHPLYKASCANPDSV